MIPDSMSEAAAAATSTKLIALLPPHHLTLCFLKRAQAKSLARPARLVLVDDGGFGELRAADE